MELIPFEKQAILSLLSNQFTSDVLIAWSDSLKVIKRDLNGYGYYLYFREEKRNPFVKVIKPNAQKLTQGWYFEHKDKHHVGFILWMNENGEHSLEGHPYDDKPIKQSIVSEEVSIQ